MLCILEIVRLALGIGALAGGKLPLGGGRFATGVGARVAGLFFIAPLPVACTYGFIIGAHGKIAQINDLTLALIELGIVLTFAAVGYFIAFMSSDDTGRRYLSDAEDRGSLPVMRPRMQFGRGSRGEFTERPSRRKFRRRG